MRIVLYCRNPLVEHSISRMIGPCSPRQTAASASAACSSGLPPAAPLWLLAACSAAPAAARRCTSTPCTVSTSASAAMPSAAKLLASCTGLLSRRAVAGGGVAAPPAAAAPVPLPAASRSAQLSGLTASGWAVREGPCASSSATSSPRLVAACRHGAMQRAGEAVQVRVPGCAHTFKHATRESRYRVQPTNTTPQRCPTCEPAKSGTRGPSAAADASCPAACACSCFRRCMAATTASM